ncbi:hypothetical protein ACJMK2_011486 [Sinanodonta woodiana]|uniref:Uncharacterized protein n=1 Tax=Sinanodonta woodiana TaxID=1069815 RepID=A0ABD3V6G3_SINWO
MTGDLIMSGRVFDLERTYSPVIVNKRQAVSYNHLTTAVSEQLSLAGVIMIGNINMSKNKIRNINILYALNNADITHSAR